MATEQELSDFLKSVEKRAFKRSVYHVRNEEAALDIVQDSMMKLAEHYGDKPVAELPMLFQRILSNCTLDWFRRQKTRNALFSNMSDFEVAGEDGDFGFDFAKNLGPAGQVFGAFGALAAVGAGVRLQQIKIHAIFARSLEVAHARKQCIAGFLTPKPVQRAVGQDPLVQHGELVGRFVTVVFGQLEHAVLHDVQRRFLIANMVERALEGALFYTFEEVGKFLFGCQEGSAREGGRQTPECVAIWHGEAPDYRIGP